LLPRLPTTSTSIRSVRPVSHQNRRSACPRHLLSKQSSLFVLFIFLSFLLQLHTHHRRLKMKLWFRRWTFSTRVCLLGNSQRSSRRVRLSSRYTISCSTRLHDHVFIYSRVAVMMFTNTIIIIITIRCTRTSAEVVVLDRRVSCYKNYCTNGINILITYNYLRTIL